MENNKPNYKNNLINENLIGNNAHRNLIQIQSKFGVALNGGSLPFSNTPFHLTRLANPINLLTPIEKKQLIFSGAIISN